MANILSVAQTALSAAKAGLVTTGHNIANASTPGFNRQVVIQAAVAGQNEGGGFIGKGTAVVGVRRIYSEYLADQVRTAQTSAGQLDSHLTQISRINNLMADPSSGLSPVLQDFFKSVQDLSANPGAAPSRQAMMASAESLSARFQSMDGQLRQIREAVNSEITSITGTITSYAQQIANLNEAISKAQNSANGQPPNDLLDQRDHLVAELSKETKVTVVKEAESYSIFIGNGQPMVIGPTAYSLKPVASTSDLSEMQVGFVTASGITPLAENSLTGGKLGGLLDFRSTTLNAAQNALGRMALGLADTFNAQHRLGQDQNGAMGGNFFRTALPVVNANTLNTGNAVLDASITDVGTLTTSDYRVAFDGTNYSVTRLADNTSMYSGAAFPATPIEGVSFTIASGTMASGDSFIVKPTVNGASDFSVLVTDKARIAAAAPISTATTTTNKGSGVINAGKVDASFTPATVTPAVTLTFDAAAGTLTGFPATMPVRVTSNGTTATYAAGAPVPYTAGATIEFGGVAIQISGVPANTDTFTIGRNLNSAGDNRNMLLLGALQSANTLEGGTTTYQGAFGQLVSLIGNKTHELEVTKTAESKLLGQIRQAQQSESGVNLDEEATNLLRYQQAYQAAGKVMQAVSEMFDVLISLGRG